LQARVDLTVPEPNTFHEVLATLDARLPVAGCGSPCRSTARRTSSWSGASRSGGRPSRGCRSTAGRCRGHAAPAAGDPGDRRGAVDFALFTAAQQLEHLLQVAAEEGLEAELRAALGRTTRVGSIGPTTTAALRERGLAPDIEPEHPKMGHLLAAVAAYAVGDGGPAADGPGPGRIEAVAAGPRAGTAAAPWHDSPFLRACRREPVDVTPIWLMRQAGRYMAEYRALRAKVSFLDLCKDPGLATEVTVTAAERLGVDAAILFADILLILEPMGLDLEFAKGEGPVLHNPIREPADVDRVRPLEDLAPLDFVCRAVASIRAALDPALPLIGFAGAPFTLACYAIEGGSSRHYERAKALMYRDPGAWDALMERFGAATAAYLNAQIAAGVQAVQVFDSWVGALGPDDYRRFVQPHMRRLFRALTPGVPVIHFGTGTGTLLELQRDAGGQVIGLDWRVELDRAWDRLGGGVGVQGNLDPALLLAPIEEIRGRPGGSSTRPGAAPATSSTSATASCRRRRSTTSGRWSTSSTSTAGRRAPTSRRRPPRSPGPWGTREGRGLATGTSRVHPPLVPSGARDAPAPIDRPSMRLA
jgi:uroporphyrinogen decarboxylase